MLPPPHHYYLICLYVNMCLCYTTTNPEFRIASNAPQFHVLLRIHVLLADWFSGIFWPTIIFNNFLQFALFCDKADQSPFYDTGIFLFLNLIALTNNLSKEHLHTKWCKWLSFLFEKIPWPNLFYSKICGVLSVVNILIH